MDTPQAWWAETVGASVGVTAGCLLGLVPLLVLHEAGSGACHPPLAALAFRISGRVGGDGEEDGRGGTLGGWSANEAWVEGGRVSGLERGVARSRGQSDIIASIRAPEVVPPPLERQRVERYVPLVLFLAVSLGIRRVWQFVHRKE